MPGMKRDCGGAAGILGAFYAAVKQGMRVNKRIFNAWILNLASFTYTIFIKVLDKICTQCFA